MNNKSFTLVEMLVVLVVVGMLIAMAVIGIQAVQTGSRESQRGNDIRNFQGLVEDYYSKFKQYPSMNPADHQLKFDDAFQTQFAANTLEPSEDYTYICLLPVGLDSSAYNAVSCDSSTESTGNVYRVYKMGMPARFIRSIPFASPYFGADGTTAQAHCTANNVPPSYSTWFLYYSVEVTSRPQAYRLGFCSEYGLKNPSGSKLD
ncbi:MAG: prepilin-type N-terminal cleavage/methylation domain-containing protein [bacterium]